MTGAPPDRTLLFVAFICFIDMCGLGLIIPVLPSLIGGLGHVSIDRAAEIGGLLLFAYAMMQFLFAPIIGGFPQFDLPIQRDTCQSRVDWFLVYSVEHLVHWVFVVLHFCNKPLVQWSCWKQLLSEICQIHDIMI